jgi:hypothetical protein
VPEWLTEIPSDINGAMFEPSSHELTEDSPGWLVMPRPRGPTVTVLSGFGRTVVRDAHGVVVRELMTALPRGSPSQHDSGIGGSDAEHCLLEAVHCVEHDCYFVTDVLSFGDVPAAEHTLDFRRFWLMQQLNDPMEALSRVYGVPLPSHGGWVERKAAESAFSHHSSSSTGSASAAAADAMDAMDDAETASATATTKSATPAKQKKKGPAPRVPATNQCRFFVAPAFECDTAGLLEAARFTFCVPADPSAAPSAAAASATVQVPMDGFIFGCKAAAYETGPSPFSLRWKDAYGSVAQLRAEAQARPASFSPGAAAAAAAAAATLMQQTATMMDPVECTMRAAALDDPVDASVVPIDPRSGTIVVTLRATAPGAAAAATAEAAQAMALHTADDVHLGEVPPQAVSSLHLRDGDLLRFHCDGVASSSTNNGGSNSSSDSGGTAMADSAIGTAEQEHMTLVAPRFVGRAPDLQLYADTSSRIQWLSQLRARLHTLHRAPQGQGQGLGAAEGPGPGLGAQGRSIGPPSFENIMAVARRDIFDV